MVNQEKIVAQVGDQEQGLMMGCETRPGEKKHGRYVHGMNVFPSEEWIPELRATVDGYFARVWELQKTMRWLVGLSLDLDPDTSFVRDVLEDAIVVVRFLHYPPSVEKDVTGIGAHTDRSEANTLTGRNSYWQKETLLSLLSRWGPTPTVPRSLTQSRKYYEGDSIQLTSQDIVEPVARCESIALLYTFEVCYRISKSASLSSSS